MRIKSFCKSINMEKDALDFFVLLNKKIEKLSIYGVVFSFAKKAVCGIEEREYLDGLNNLSVISKDIGVNKYSLHFLFLIYGFILLKNEYKKRKIDKKIYLETASDILYKMRECKDVYGVYGTFVAWWYVKFFNLEIIKLGRLEFERRTLPFDSYNKFGINLKKDDDCFAIHIPSSGPLYVEDIISSLKSGYRYFNLSGNIPFIVHSWIILKENKDILPKNSNLKKFYNLCDILYNDYEDGYSDCWRIFKCNYNGNPDSLEQRTSLQKNIVSYLKSGGKMGEGMGVLVFDGENILTGKKE